MSISADAKRLLDGAIKLHQNNQLQEAKLEYAKILEIDQNNFDALQLLGTLASQEKDFEKAQKLLARALKINPEAPAVLNNIGSTYRSLKKYQLAIDSYSQAIALKPDYLEAILNKGNVYAELKDANSAYGAYIHALTVKELDSKEYHRVGKALLSIDRVDESLLIIQKSLELDASFALAQSDFALALKKIKEFDLARIAYQKAISLEPNSRYYPAELGALELECKRFTNALDLFDISLKLDASYDIAWTNRGNALMELRRFDEAITSHAEALKINPKSAIFYSNRGVTYERADKNLEAKNDFLKALELDSNYIGAFLNAGFISLKMKDRVGAFQYFEKALEIDPNAEFARGAKLHSMMSINRWDASFHQEIKHLETGISIGKKIADPFTVLPLTHSAPIQLKAASIWANDKYPIDNSLGPIQKRLASSKIRIGYYSADFHNHATTYLMSELLELHDKNRFEIYGFTFGPNEQDEMRDRISKTFFQFYDVRNASDKDIAAFSRQLGIDIAVDLKGYTQDSRAGIFSYRAAPIQINYLGYPGTMGTEAMDYIIADKILIPPEFQKFYSEKVIYLPDSYQVNDSKRVISEERFSRQELGLPEKAFVFCCFNNNYKITPDTFDVWMRVLHAVPGSVLWLFEDNSVAASNLKKEAQSRGIDPDRLIFAKRLPIAQHLARHRAADLFLDNLPCNAHTTASDALWSGLPILTQVGEAFASRVAASLLSAIGLPELITQTSQEYEAMAIHLATHPEALKNLKDKLQENRLSGPLFNSKKFTGHLEEAYEAAYARYTQGLNAENLIIGMAEDSSQPL